MSKVTVDNGAIYESVKIRKVVVDDVRKYTKTTGQTITGFFSTLAVEFFNKKKNKSK